jgi:hypothetical protein
MSTTPRTPEDYQRAALAYSTDRINHGKPPRTEPPAGWLANPASCFGCSLAGAWPVLLVLLVVGISGWQQPPTNDEYLVRFPLQVDLGCCAATASTAAATAQPLDQSQPILGITTTPARGGRLKQHCRRYFARDDLATITAARTVASPAISEARIDANESVIGTALTFFTTASSSSDLVGGSSHAASATTTARHGRFTWHEFTRFLLSGTNVGEAGLAPTNQLSRFSATTIGIGGDALAPALPPAFEEDAGGTPALPDPPAPYAAYLASHARAGVDCRQVWELIAGACMRWSNDNPELPPPDPAIPMVLAAHESELRTWAVGSHGERGMLQILPDHDAGMRRMGLNSLSEPDRLLFALYLYHWHGWQPWSVRDEARADLRKLQGTSTRGEGSRAKGQGPRGER